MSLRYHNPVQIRFGAGAVAELPEVLGGRRAVLVAFPEAEALGLTARLRGILGARLATLSGPANPRAFAAR